MFHIKLLMASIVVLVFSLMIEMCHDEKSKGTKKVYNIVELSCVAVIFLEIMYAIWSIPSSSGFH